MTSALPRRALALTCATALGGLGLAISPPALASSTAGASTAGRTTVTAAPRWLARAQKQATSAAATAGSQTVRVYLSPRGGLAALQAKVARLSDPSSAQYQHWLTAQQYDAAYAPTAQSVAEVSAYLRSQGLTVTGVEKHHRYVSATGSRSALGAAFGTTLATYHHDGQTVTANAGPVSVPASLGASVLAVTGLDTTVSTKTPQHVVPGATGDAPAVTSGLAKTAVNPNATPPSAFQNGRPCAINFGNPLAFYKADYSTPLPKFGGETLPYAPCGYTGPSFRAAYEGNSDLDGSGVTVAITDAYAWQFLERDANQYAGQHGDGTYAPGQLTQSLPAEFTRRAACDPSGWSGEEVLDVEAVHAMAPAAKIKYYASASCFDADFLETLGRVVDDNDASIVTNSWSDLEANESADNVAAYEQVFLQGATQGITFLFSSGDNGDELAKTGIKQVDYPASDPYATAAGGTSTGIAGGRITSQTGWGTHSAALSSDGKRWVDSGFLYGAGGGYSSLFNRPSFQEGVVPTTAPAGRAVPDIAMDADPNTGMLIGQTQTFPDGVHYGEYRIGGTSLASPLLAGMMALANQGAGKGLGWVNPLVYSAPSSQITDVTHGTAKGIQGVVRANNVNGIDPTDGLSYFVRTFDQDSSLASARGWDPVSGLGVPNPAFLTAVSAKD